LGRPKKWKGWRVTSLMVYEEYEDAYEKAKELADREGITFSELVARALSEYVSRHYPGNPQLPLIHEDQPPYRLRTAEVEAEWISEGLRRLLSRGPETWDYDQKALVREWTLKLARLNARLRDPELDGLVEEARRAVR